MKVLVTYFSQTGNTEKIATVICEEALTTNESDISKLEKINMDDLSGYDFIFIGSPLHAGNLAAPVQDFLNRMQPVPGQKIAGFITHAALAYPDQDMEKFTEPIKNACRKNKMEYIGCFDCQGFLTEELHEMIKKRQGLTDEQWAERLKQMAGHPDAKDVEMARSFAKKVLA
ncbi:MAG: flavodoxin [Proteobacteria bacterium]|nr:flavodoxin [Pseudomonadota bacterium]MBU1582063.1 flavodoxin [Pseudomonadota bacterium]MBU2452127.1 flavodoxin [Pseudomonadota bacterium]MBU2628366.1 flavodoxin [Pseudomonadota bacterium]